MGQRYGITESAFLRSRDQILDALVAMSPQLIQWPERTDYQDISAFFDEMGQ